MDNPKLKAIIFDLGNVCIDFGHLNAVKRLANFTDQTTREIISSLFDAQIINNFERGLISPEDFFVYVKNAINLTISYGEFVLIWNDIFFLTENNLEVHRIIKLLKNDYRLAILSNINVLHFQYLADNFPLFNPFDILMFSFNLHLRKPSHDIYKKALEILNLSPDEVFYTDDRKDFIEQAQLLGIRSFHFQGSKKLKTDLLSVGIRTD